MALHHRTLGPNGATGWTPAQTCRFYPFGLDGRRRTYLPRVWSVLFCSDRRLLLALQENSQERRGWISRGVVSVCICDVSTPPVEGRIHRFTHVYSIGDWYPERNIFQILIAVNSGKQAEAHGVACSEIAVQVLDSCLYFCNIYYSDAMPMYYQPYCSSLGYCEPCPVVAGCLSPPPTTTTGTIFS